MAKYTGYVTIPIDSYANFKAAVNGNGYDADGSFGCQCWDLAAEFWWNVGFPQGYPTLTGTDAYTMWSVPANRLANSAYNGTTYFDLVNNLEDVQLGDVMVFNYTAGNPYGHVGFADVDYSNWTPDPNAPYEYPILSENNGGTPDPDGGAYTNIHGYDSRLFLGAFRFKAWHTTPPTPTPTSTSSHFKWVLYARKLRDKRSGM